MPSISFVCSQPQDNFSSHSCLALEGMWFHSNTFHVLSQPSERYSCQHDLAVVKLNLNKGMTLTYSSVANLKTDYIKGCSANLNYTKFGQHVSFLWKSFFINMSNEVYRKIGNHNYTENLHQKSKKYLRLSPRCNFKKPYYYYCNFP